jgi:hypothetical protein
VILAAVFSNFAVVAATYTVRGWNAAGAHAAARNSARLSTLWFAVAFAAPGLARFFRSLPTPATLVHSFFAAHAVHFAAVVVLLTRFEFSHVSQHPSRAAAVVSGGFLLVLVAALTATAGPPWAYLHRVTLYAVFLIFFLVFVVNPARPLRALAVLLVLSFFLRLCGAPKFQLDRINSAA